MQKLILVEVTGVQFTFLLTKGTVWHISDTLGEKKKSKDISKEYYRLLIKYLKQTLSKCIE